MATVYSAGDTRLPRDVAVKRLKNRFVVVDEKRERFFFEACIMAQLEHPGIVPVYDAGVDPVGNHFYAMKKVSGDTLYSILNKQEDDPKLRARSAMELLLVFERICETIAFAHSKGVVHRDLKPANIMVDDFGMVYVLDWGVAKKLDDSGAVSQSLENQPSKRYLGSPHYMAPEQARGRSFEASERTDVFALGILLYEILAGARPFGGDDVKEIFDSILNHDPVPPHRLNSRISRDISAICMKALCKDPRQRYPSARELAEDITRFRSYLPVSARRPTLQEHVYNWARREQFLSAVLLTAMVAILLTAGAGGWQYYKEKQVVRQANTRIAQSRGRIDELQSKLEQRTAQRGNLISKGSSTISLDGEIDDIEARVFIERFGLSRRLAAVVGFTFFAPDESAISEIKRQNIEVVEQALEQGDYAAVIAYSEYFIRSAREISIIEYTPEELEVLKKAKAKARLMRSKKK